VPLIGKNRDTTHDAVEISESARKGRMRGLAVGACGTLIWHSNCHQKWRL